MPMNKYMVGMDGAGRVSIIAWGKILNKTEALTLAAYIVALADPLGEEFKKVLEEVQHT